MKEFERLMQPLNVEIEPKGESLALDWGEHEYGTHRYHVRQLVEESVQRLARMEKAAVLGAGNHGEVDLPGLALHFQQVTVMDSEDNMLQEWLESTGGMGHQRVKSLTGVDYTGLDQISFYETYEELLQSGAAASELAGYLRDCAFQVRLHETMPHLKKTFSLVISSGVHTQLFYLYALTQFYSHMGRYSEPEVRQIVEALVYLRNSLVTDYNQLLLSLVKPDGRVAAWTEMIVLDEEKRWIADELYQMRTEGERRRFLFEAFGKYGLEAAVLGLKDLYDKLRPEQQLFHCWVWHTESGKACIAAGISGLPRP
ncbi:hypothetical protein ACFQI7_05265 [Paenibacillus allorhizosphaerae]|uniref:Class I SAM-dependent methyltransferase n=1 Tax=Paenibacillus allorhizosphaerae TaxID=2849866 RepID=A0ABM8VBT7_9BACL|nr:hypothetical protein [Paenibacillus allorhizosphaerae]CAG7621927.1 hypothetical protein PAECIP111802_00772 [Paenibacillus allorhizosphaerae]